MLRGGLPSTRVVGCVRSHRGIATVSWCQRRTFLCCTPLWKDFARSPKTRNTTIDSAEDNQGKLKEQEREKPYCQQVEGTQKRDEISLRLAELNAHVQELTQELRALQKQQGNASQKAASGEVSQGSSCSPVPDSHDHLAKRRSALRSDVIVAMLSCTWSLVKHIGVGVLVLWVALGSIVEILLLSCLVLGVGTLIYLLIDDKLEKSGWKTIDDKEKRWP